MMWSLFNWFWIALANFVLFSLILSIFGSVLHQFVFHFGRFWLALVPFFFKVILGCFGSVWVSLGLFGIVLACFGWFWVVLAGFSLFWFAKAFFCFYRWVLVISGHFGWIWVSCWFVLAGLDHFGWVCFPSWVALAYFGLLLGHFVLF